jgi:hypothetical protein
MNQLTFFAEEPPAKTLALETRTGLGWMDQVRLSPSVTSDLWNDTSPVGSSGKMFRMRWGVGIPRDFSALPQTLPSSGILLPGECLISDGLGNPTSPARGCSWSDIVTLDAPQRYYLSPKALAGIAKRDRKPRLFSPQAGEWLSMIERHAFWTETGRALQLR